MKLTLNSVALHDLGEVSILSQSSVFSPDEMAQRETRTITFQVEFWEQSFKENYDLVTAARAALSKQHVDCLWQGPDEEVNEETVAGPIYLQTPVDIVSHDLPENPNAWGTYQQQIKITVRHEINRSHADALQGTFKKTGAIGSPLSLGNVTGWRESYRSQRNSEMRNDRSRASGEVTAKGEIVVANTADTLSNRRAWLAAQKEALDTAVNSKDGTLTLGTSGQFFNRTVKVDAWSCDVDQACTAIRWSLTAVYTKFPSEAGYAAADFRVNTSEDQESGDKILTISGRVASNSESVATAKMEGVRDAARNSAGFGSANLVSSSVEPDFINCDDTSGSSVFNSLSFTFTYRKRAATMVSFKLTISDSEAASAGLLQRTYSGSVTATASTDAAAYDAAVAKAQELGENKHPIRVRGSVTRQDRKTAVGTQEFVSVDFSYEYTIKGERIYLEVKTDANSETFGEDSINVSGFVVSKDTATARAAYLAQVKAAYSSYIIRGERTSTNKIQLGKGAYGARFTPTSGYETLETALEFGFTALTEKATGNWAIKYGIRIDYDDVSLRKNATVSGVFVGSPANLTAAENGTAGNQLDIFLAGLSLGTRVQHSRGSDHEKTPTKDVTLGLQFSDTYIDSISAEEQILECSVEEEIDYSGTRWVFQPIPDGPAVPQDCGETLGGRVITGSVKASTETAAMAWVQKQNPENEDSIFHNLPTGVGGGETPEDRYFQPPKIRRVFDDFIPTIEGVARGEAANPTCVKVQFTFAEALPSFPYNA